MSFISRLKSAFKSKQKKEDVKSEIIVTQDTITRNEPAKPTIAQEETTEYWIAKAGDMTTAEGKAILLQRIRDAEFLQRGIQNSRAKSALEYAIVSLHPYFDSSERNVAHYAFEIDVYTTHHDLNRLRDKVQRDWQRILSQYKDEPKWNSHVKETIAKAHKSFLCQSLESIAEDIHEKEYREAKIKFDEVVRLKQIVEENKTYGDDQNRVIDFPMWERYDKAKKELYYASDGGLTEYCYKSILSKRANAAFLMASILSNACESQLVQRELSSIIQNKSHECEFWYIHEWIIKDGTDKSIDRYEHIAEMVANNASPNHVVHFLTHSIPGGCNRKTDAICRTRYLHYAAKLPAPYNDQLRAFALNSARKEFEEELQDFYNSGTSNSNTKRKRLESIATECENLGDSMQKARFYERTGEYPKALAIFVANNEWERAAGAARYIDGLGKEEALYLYLSGKRDWAAQKAEKLGEVDMAIAIRSGTYTVDERELKKHYESERTNLGKQP